MWILLIEDEERLGHSLVGGLSEEGYTVDWAKDGLEGEAMALANSYDILIVDWRLPRQDGKTLIEHLRAAERSMPILMLTALDDIDHRIAGLDAGADDYLPKPFSFEELLARLRALLRRPPLDVLEAVILLGPLEVNTKRRQARFFEQVLALRPKEYELLELLARHPGEALSRTVIAERVWGDPFYVTDNVIDVTIFGLRQKVLEAQTHASRKTVRITTVRGVGYCLEHEPDGFSR